MNSKLAMVIDASTCIDCKACMSACKVANKVPRQHWRNWIKSANLDVQPGKQGRMRFQPGNCMHCDKPTCVDACPTGATYKDETDGTVRIDRGVCIGCGQCVAACPYGARYRHPELRVADKCDFCADRRAAGLEPACVSTCPTKTRAFGDLNNPEDELNRLLEGKKTVQVVNARSDTDPNIYYLGNPGIEDWPVEARMPSAFEFWKSLAGPLVKLFVGLSAAGFGAMLVKQLITPGGGTEQNVKEGEKHD